MLNPRIDFLRSPSSARICVASELISWFDSRARIRSLMNSSKAGRYLFYLNRVSVFKINFFVDWT
jgi:hypothetical protein